MKTFYNSKKILKLFNIFVPEKQEDINSFSEKVNKLINPVIKQLLTSYVDKKNKEVVFYQIEVGGKRLRPALAMICCKMLRGKIKDVIYPAAGLEILHNYSLIIDDIIDNSQKRRGEPTCWVKFGSSVSQCIGVDYSAAIFQSAKNSKDPTKISEIFSTTLKEIVDGEIMDMLFEQRGRENEPYIVKNRYKKINEKDYLYMINKKTSALFRSCCEIGGICADANQKQLEALREYGLNIGIAFQVKDDILDIFGKERKFGKKIGKDIMERKRGNIVVLLALKQLNSSDKNELSEILKKDRISRKNVKKAVAIIEKTNAKNLAFQFGEKYIQKAKDNLDLLPHNKWNQILKQLTEFTLTREK